MLPAMIQGFLPRLFLSSLSFFAAPAPSSSPFSFVLPVFHFFRLQIHISRTFFWIFCFFPNHVFLRVRFRRIIIFFGLFFKNVSFSRFLRILFRPVRLRFSTAFSRVVRIFIPGIFKAFLTEGFLYLPDVYLTVFFFFSCSSAFPSLSLYNITATL